jgi:hypothetical protein
MHLAQRFGALALASLAWLGVAASAEPVAVLSVTGPGPARYGISYGLVFAAKFSAPVTVSGAPSLRLTVGGAQRKAEYSFGSGYETLYFRYNIVAGDDGSVAIASPIDLNGGSIRAADGTDAGLAFTPPDLSGVIADGIAPAPPVIESVAATTTPSFTGTAEANSIVTVTVASGSYEWSLHTTASLGLAGTGWQLSSNLAPLAPGTYTATATTRDAASNVSGPSGAVTFTIPVGSSSPYVSPTITSITPPPYAMSPGPWVFTGTAPAGASLALTLQSGPGVSQPVKLVTGIVADANGTWQAQASMNSPGGTYTFYTQTLDVLNQPFATSASVAATVSTSGNPDTSPPIVASFGLFGSTTRGATEASFAIEFSKPVTGVDVSDFAIVTTGATIARIDSFTSGTSIIGPPPPPAGIRYEFRVGYDGGPGSLQLRIKSSGTGIIDTGGNAFAGGGLTSTIPLTFPGGDLAIPPTQNANGTVGVPFSYQVVATNAKSYQLNMISAPLPAGLTLDSSSGIISGTPTTAGTTTIGVRISDIGGSANGNVVITIAPSGPPPTGLTGDTRLVNLSSRVHLSAGDASRGAIAGFVVSSTAPKQILIRAIGPALATFGLANPVPALQLQIFDHNATVLATNSGWSNNSEIAAAGDSVGAFKLAPNSRDAAVLLTLPAGSYTAQVQSANSGTALVEVYDAAVNTPAPTKQLINISTRGVVGLGDDVMVAGFVIGGADPKRVLIRAVGPGLAAFGVADVLADPMLKLVDVQGATLTRNDNWENALSGDSLPTTTTAADVNAANTAVGAFAFPAGSKDAALVVTLKPGAYTAIVNGNSGTTGAALVEVYDLPEASR